MKKILLLGQDGMLGGELSNRLKNKGYDVYDTTIQTLDMTGQMIIYTDIITEALIFICIQYLFHQAR